MSIKGVFMSMGELNEVGIVVGDYTSKKDSWLKELEELSQKRGDRGLLHSGCILWIQSYVSDNFGFTLKAAIAPILDAVPSIFPKDLPDQVLDGKITRLNDTQKKFLVQLNEGLILPVTADDIAGVIVAGQEYEKLESNGS